MELLKVSDGLLEVENFYLTSPFSDFLGEGTTHRNGSVFYIDLNTKIERNFEYNRFVIQINKNNWDTVTKKDYFQFYVISGEDEYGLEDNLLDGQSKYQKIIYEDGFLQAYTSSEGKVWNNLGGLSLSSIIKQGFRKNHDSSLALNKYQVFKNPYITIQNMGENSKLELYDKDNNKLKERLFDKNRECVIYLDYPMDGYVKIYDDKGVLFFQSSLTTFSYGDVFTMSPCDLDIIYNGIVLDNTTTTFNPSSGISFTEMITIKNKASNPCNNLKLSTITKYDDIITLSLDNTNFTKEVVISELLGNESKDLYVKIDKGATNHNYIWRDFELKINSITT